jgi:hypothetical protein
MGLEKIHLAARPDDKNILNLLNTACDLQADATVIVQSDLAILQPEWLNNLLQPILKGNDLVTPLYSASRYQMMLNNLAIYPLVRCLWGRRIRQPLGTERGLSLALIQNLLQTPSDLAYDDNFELWSTVNAIHCNCRACQAYVGGVKIYSPPQDAGIELREIKNLAAAFIQTMLMLFKLAQAAPSWRGIRWSRPTPVYGIDLKDKKLTMVHSLSLPALLKACQENWQAAYEFFNWHNISSGLLQKSYNISSMNNRVWARLNLAALAIYLRQPSLQLDIIQALQPAFMARIAYFIENTKKVNYGQREEFIESQCLTFEDLKNEYLKNI